jgi:uncharacterized YigZ family protein
VSEVFFEPSLENHAEIEIKKSRFIGTVRRARTAEEARDLVRGERALHPDARHVVYAFLIGGPKSETAGMSDDGEPKGTAGRPVLEVLRGSGVRNALVTVTRYFGGTKLGTGGLVRAYTEGARAALRDLPVTRCAVRRSCFLTLPYEYYEPVRRLLEARGAEAGEEIFGETVSLRFSVEEGAVEELEGEIRDLTRGRSVLRVL